MINESPVFQGSHVIVIETERVYEHFLPLESHLDGKHCVIKDNRSEIAETNHTQILCECTTGCETT